KRGFSEDLSQLRGTTLTARCNVRVTSRSGRLSRIATHPATTVEFKQFEFLTLRAVSEFLEHQERNHQGKRQSVALPRPRNKFARCNPPPRAPRRLTEIQPSRMNSFLHTRSILGSFRCPG